MRLLEYRKPQSIVYFYPLKKINLCKLMDQVKAGTNLEGGSAYSLLELERTD